MMREKRRYLLVQITSPASRFSEEDARRVIREAVSQLLGDFGAAKAKVAVKLYEEQKQLALVRCALSEQEKVIASFALKTSFGGKPVLLRLQKIFGTLLKTRELFPDARPQK